MTTQLEICFDYLSPFSYFGWQNARALCARRNLQLIPVPVVFGALLDHFGQRGPAEIAPKREYTFKTCARYAALHGIPMRGPKKHPFNSLAALRMSLREVAGERQIELAAAIWDAIWIEGIDGGDPAELQAAVTARGFDGASLLARTREPAVKDALRANTERAIARGVFGVPTFFAGDELFWGNDSLEYVELYLDGKDPLDRTHLTEVLARPRGVDRKL